VESTVLKSVCGTYLPKFTLSLSVGAHIKAILFAKYVDMHSHHLFIFV
jgi:hypothetical protein